MTSRFGRAIDALEAALIRSSALRKWLRSRRWCGETLGMRSEMSIKDRLLLAESRDEAIVFFLALARDAEAPRLLNLPLSLTSTRIESDAFEFALGSEAFFVTDAEDREAFARFLADGFRRSPKLPTRSGDHLRFHGESLGTFRSWTPLTGGDTSNLLVRIAASEREIIYKSYKLLEPSNREPRILERLHQCGFAHVPRFLGDLSLGRGEERLVLGVVTEAVDSEDLFHWLLEGWRSASDSASPPRAEFETTSLELIGQLGETTADLHDSLSERKTGPFQIETFTREDMRSAYRIATSNLTDSLRMLARQAHGDGGDQVDSAMGARTSLLDHRRAIEEMLTLLELSVGTAKTVTHGDLHLGQVLRSRRDGSLFFIDFEGEPERVAGQRSMKLPPLRDVATMNRSFSYVRHFAWRDRLAARDLGSFGLPDHEESLATGEALLRRMRSWETDAMETYSRRYLARTNLYPGLDTGIARQAIRAWMMEKALYELRYELKHRPQNISIALEGILSLANRGP